MNFLQSLKYWFTTGSRSAADMPQAIDPSIHVLLTCPWSWPRWQGGAGENDWLQAVRAALLRDVDVDAWWMGETPLFRLLTSDDDSHWRIAAGDRDVLDSPYAKAARMLLACGADIDARDQQGATMLHRVASRWNRHSPYTHAVELLLELGADKMLRDYAGKTPLDLAGGKTAELIAAAR